MQCSHHLPALSLVLFPVAQNLFLHMLCKMLGWNESRKIPYIAGHMGDFLRVVEVPVSLTSIAPKIFRNEMNFNFQHEIITHLYRFYKTL